MLGDTPVRLRSDGAIVNDGGAIISNSGLIIQGATTARASSFTNSDGGLV